MNKFKKIGIAISLGIALFGGIWLASPSQAAGCNKFNVVYCGTNSMSELQSAYSRSEIKSLYSQWYITETMVQGGSNMREGVVDASGNITVDGRVVVTNAVTVQSKAGTLQPAPQRTYSAAGYTYYQYTTGQSFVDGPKSYRIYAWFDDNGKFITGVIKDCGNPVWGPPTTPPAKPALTCDVLQVAEVSRDTFKFSTKATAKDGATITSYTYDFGDGNTQTTTSSEIQHTYAKAGNYKVTVTVNGKEAGEVKRQSPNCEKTITVKDEPKIQVCDLATKKYPVTIKESEFNEKKHSKNPNDCKEAPSKIKVCVIKTKEIREIKKEEFNELNHTTDMSKCQETPATPTPSPELPTTGAGDVIMSALGLGGLTAATIAYVVSRRQM